MITIEKAALAEIGAIREYMKRDEEGNVVVNAENQPVVAGHFRQVVFVGPGLKGDVLPFNIFHDEARGFNLPIGTQGKLSFTVKGRTRRSEESELSVGLVMVDFEPNV